MVDTSRLRMPSTSQVWSTTPVRWGHFAQGKNLDTAVAMIL
jgi:hypothetical protein